MQTRLIAAAVGAAFTLLGPAILKSAESDSVAYHDMSAIAKAPYGPYPEMRTVLADSSSLAIATVPRQWKQSPHWHNQEQISIGRDGAMGLSIDSVLHQLGSHGAGLPPPNVEHGMANDTEQLALVIEYQPVLRTEWLPPHAQVPPQPKSAEPMHVSPNQQITIDFDPSSSGWNTERNGARAKILNGQTIRATFWDLSTPRASVDVAAPPTTRERLVLVLDGHVLSVIGAAAREIGPEMLVEVRPSADHLTLRSLGRGAAMIVVFETLNHRRLP